MDGNGRWARRRNLPRTAGHTEGEENLAAVVRLAVNATSAGSPCSGSRPRTGFGRASRFATSSGCTRSCSDGSAELNDLNVRVQWIGRPFDGPDARTPRYVQKAIRKAIADTASNTGMVLTVAFDYGSRAEIVHAADAAIKQAQATAGHGSRPPTSTRTCTCPSFRPSTWSCAHRASDASPTSCCGRSAGSPVYFTEQTWPDFGTPRRARRRHPIAIDTVLRLQVTSRPTFAQVRQPRPRLRTAFVA